MDTTNSLFGIHAAALGLREARLDVLASNLANVDTPNYKARDIDFAQALQEATSAANPANSANAAHSSPVSAGNEKTSVSLPPDPNAIPALRYRIPVQPSLDGNTVDAEFEHASFARSALEYRATLSFISSRAHTLMTAITGN